MSISGMQRIKKMLLLTSHPVFDIQLILFYVRIYLGLIIILCTSNRLCIPFSNLGFPASDLGFPGGANAGDMRDEGLIPGLGRSPGGVHGNPPRYSCLENPHGQRSMVGYSP